MIERRQKRIPCLGERAFEQTGGFDDTTAGVVEAGDNIHIGLHQADHLADADRSRRLAQTEPAIPAAHRVDQPGNPKLMNHLHQMIFRDIIALCDIRNRREAFRLQGRPE